MSAPEVRETVLLVDDQPANLLVLSDALAGMGVDVLTARDGEQALQVLEKRPVDLILLDAMMPGVSGFEVARQVRQRRGDEVLPIVMVTSLDSADDLERAFRAGVNDFLRWPVSQTEVRARVRSFLQLRRQERALAAALRSAEVLSDLQEDLVALLVHDLKGPLATIKVLTGLVREAVEPCAPETKEDLSAIDALCGRLSDMALELIDISRMEQAQLVPAAERIALGQLVRDTRTGLDARAASRGVSLAADGDAALTGDRKLLTRVLQNLADNALAHTPRGGTVQLRAAALDAGGAELRVTNTGSRIALHERERIFEKYASLEGSSGNRGLGLYFCRLAVRAHGGTLAVEGPEDGPVSFVVRLPGASAAASNDG